LVVLFIALARPQAEVQLPRVEGTVILVFDVSGSMAADDVEPSRLEAAKKAAREFVASQPESVKIGLVTFSGSGFTVQPPTNDPNTLLAAIDRLKPQNGTSLGQGILVALNTIAVDAGLVKESQAPSNSGSPAEPGQPPAGNPQAPGDDILAQLPEGPFPSSVIVLLSDGENNAPPDPAKAAQAAAERNVRVDALGFGTPSGATLEIDGFKIHTILDENALQLITQTAGGTYYNAQTQTDPEQVYANLVPRLVIKPENMEVTSIFTGAGLLALMLGGVFSLIWNHRLP
jgi:Ca-activated chloride channel homolog